ncbi:MAG: DUF6286 domain-containing protein [Aeromicrobium erythreum]
MSTPAPRGRPRAALVASLIALVLLAAGVAAIHDFLVARGWSSGTSWTSSAADSLDGLQASIGTSVTGGLIALVGLAVVWAAIKPAPRTHDLAPADGVEVWVSRSALRRIASDAAEQTPAVDSAEASVRRREVRVKVRTPDPTVTEAVTQNVTSALDGLTDRRVSVKAQEVSYD